MKLVIREYLELLKESKELDDLIPDLLLSMGIRPLSKPQIGVRQFGVDVAAVGTDEDGVKKLFLITIKQGDLDRNDWSTNKQSIRQSLEDILDVYLNNHVRVNHKGLIKKIVLCTGGNLKEEVGPNWNGFSKKYTKKNKIEFDLWDGNKLSVMIENNIFNESILPLEYRSFLRRTLALLDNSDYNLSDYFQLLDAILFKKKYGDGKTQNSKKKILKAFRLVHLCQNIVFKWSLNNNNLKPALLTSERTVLLLWEFLRVNSLTKQRVYLESFIKSYSLLYTIYNEYYNKIYAHVNIENGLSIHQEDYLFVSLNVFEQIGIVSLFGHFLLFNEVLVRQNFQAEEIIRSIVSSLKAIIKNNKASSSPCYDNQIIDISLAILFLHELGESKFIEDWIAEMITHIEYAYVNQGKYFPIQTDSFDDLLDLNIAQTLQKETLMEISTLIPTLVQWTVVLNMEDLYSLIKQKVTNNFKDTTLQIWYPNEKTDEFLYKTNAGYRSGISYAPFEFADTFEEMRKRIDDIQKNTIGLNKLTSISEGFASLIYVANRHFRTPFLPNFWELILNKKNNEK